MAKVGIWLRRARGSFGGASFAPGPNGSTIIRDTSNMTNTSNTANQQLQKMVFSTATAARSLMASIVDHSFEGTKNGSDCLNKFMSLNCKWLRAAALKELEEDGIQTANFNIKSFNFMQPNKFILAQGSLPFPSYRWSTYAAVGSRAGYAVIDGLDAKMTEAQSATTYEQFLNCFNLVPGNQITIIEVLYNGNATVQTGDAVNYSTIVRYKRLVFKTKAEGSVSGWFTYSNGNFYFTDKVIDTKRSTAAVNEMFIHMGVDIAGWTLGTAPTGYGPKAIALVRSAKSTKRKWLRSNAELAFNNDITAAAIDVLPTYGGSSSSDLGSDYYLDNAESNNSENIEPIEGTQVQNITLTTGSNPVIDYGTPTTLTAISDDGVVGFDFESNLPYANLDVGQHTNTDETALSQEAPGLFHLAIQAAQATSIASCQVINTATNEAILTVTVNPS